MGVGRDQSGAQGEKFKKKPGAAVAVPAGGRPRREGAGGSAGGGAAAAMFTEQLRAVPREGKMRLGPQAAAAGFRSGERSGCVSGGV